MARLLLAILSGVIIFLLSCAENTFDIHQEMVKIIADGLEFQMGSEDGDPDEKPVHTVRFTKDFMIGKTEVMQRDYKTMLGVNPSKFRGDSLPVDKITWFDAVLFCNALSKYHGLDTVYEYTEVIGTPGDNSQLADVKIHSGENGYRLPTEAEWEYACRGGTTTKYYWSNSSDIDTIGMYAWYSKNSGNETHNIGEKLANDYGLYDMSGNLYEWCNDWYGNYNDTAAVDPAGPAGGSGRVIRGGNWLTTAKYCKVSYRGYTNAAFSCSAIGFRIARSL